MFYTKIMLSIDHDDGGQDVTVLLHYVFILYTSLDKTKTTFEALLFIYLFIYSSI